MNWCYYGMHYLFSLSIAVYLFYFAFIFEKEIQYWKIIYIFFSHLCKPTVWRNVNCWRRSLYWLYNGNGNDGNGNNSVNIYDSEEEMWIASICLDSSELTACNHKLKLKPHQKMCDIHTNLKKAENVKGHYECPQVFSGGQYALQTSSKWLWLKGITYWME